jgi:hypothetical protein
MMSSFGGWFGPKVGTIRDAPKRRRLKLYQFRHENRGTKWVELVLLLLLAVFGSAGFAGMMARTSPIIGLAIFFGAIAFAVWAWCDVYVEKSEE